MKLFYALFASEVLARRERAQPYRQIITDPDKLYFAPVRRQITDVESMNKDEFKIYNNKAVQELRFKDPRQLTLDEAEDIADFYANLRKWQARMDDDEERELWRKEKIHQKKVQYQNIEHQYDKEKGRERKKKHGEPKTWTLDDEAERKKKFGKGKKKGKVDKVEKGNKENATRDDYIEMRERMEREEFERMRKFEDPSFEGYDDYEEEIIMDDDEDNDTAEDRKRRDADKEKVSTGADDIGKKMRGRRDARMFEMPLPQEDDVEYIDEDDEDDDEPRYKHYREDGLPHPREYFGKHEEEEEEIHYSEDQLYRDNLRVQEITAQLFQTQGDMEFDAVWDRVKMHIPESFAKGKDDWKLKAIFQQQAQNMRDDENLRMRAAEVIQKQRAEKEHYQRFARKMMDKYEGDL